VVAQVVVRGDVLACGPAAVARHPAQGPLGKGQQRMEAPTPAIERTEVAAGDPHQRDQVLAIPEPVAIGLAEADAPPEQRSMEARRPHLEGCREITGLAEPEAPAVRFDQLDRPAPQAREEAEGGSPAGSLDRGHRLQPTTANAESHGVDLNPPTLL